MNVQSVSFSRDMSQIMEKCPVLQCRSIRFKTFLYPDPEADHFQNLLRSSSSKDTPLGRTRQHLRPAETSTLLVPSTRRSTLGDRSFPVATARAWNALPQHVRNAPSLSVFRRELKTVLFRSSFPDVI